MVHRALWYICNTKYPTHLLFYRFSYAYASHLNFMSSMQADLADQLHSLSVQERDTCPRCKDFKDTVQHDCTAMLSALGEYRDLSISEPAPPAPDFPTPPIPPGRPGKRLHGFMSLREPLADDWGPHQHEPRHSTTSATSTQHMPFSNVATPSQQHVLGSASSFLSPSQFADTASAGPSSHYPQAPPQSSAYDPALSFLTTPSQYPPYPYSSMTALLTDPFTFGVEYSAHSFEPGGSSHIQEQPFSTLHQPIPPVQSPMWDLNSPQQ